MSGNVSSRYSSMRSAAIRSCTMLRLPMTITSRGSRLTVPATSPPTACEFAHADASVSVREATSLGTLFMRTENGSSRPAQIRENRRQVFRPSSRTPLSSTLPSRNGSPVTASRPCRKTQPPAGVPPDPSGSDTMPSRVTNSMTITLTMRLLWSVLTGTYQRHRPDSSRPEVSAGGDLPGQAKRLEHVRIGEHDVAGDPAAGDGEDLQRVQPVPAAGFRCVRGERGLPVGGEPRHQPAWPAHPEHAAH